MRSVADDASDLCVVSSDGVGEGSEGSEFVSDRSVGCGQAVLLDDAAEGRLRYRRVRKPPLKRAVGVGTGGEVEAENQQLARQLE